MHVVFNDKTLAENKQRVLRLIQKKITKLKVSWKARIRQVYSTSQMNFLRNSRTSQYRTAIQDKEKEQNEYEEKVMQLDLQKKDIEKKDLKQWYDSLQADLKMKMVKYSPLNPKDLNTNISSQSTLADDDDLTERDDDELTITDDNVDD